jgi:hypothetical protein
LDTDTKYNVGGISKITIYKECKPSGDTLSYGYMNMYPWDITLST